MPNDSRLESILRPCSSKITFDKNNVGQCFRSAACVPSNPVIEATCQLQWRSDLTGYTQNVAGVRWGTAFFVAPHILVTAGHCFDKENEERGWTMPRIDGVLQEPKQFATLMDVVINYVPRACGKKDEADREKRIPVALLREYRISGLDFAVFEVENYKHPTFLDLDPDFTSGKIAYAHHPRGFPKMYEEGEAWTDSEQKISVLKYFSNTLDGSSGSAMTCCETYKVAGVHTGSMPVLEDSEDMVNYALHTRAILEVSPALKAVYRLNHPFLGKPIIVKPLDKTRADLTPRRTVNALAFTADLATAEPLEKPRKQYCALQIAGVIAVIAVLGVVGYSIYQCNKKKKVGPRNLYRGAILNGGSSNVSIFNAPSA